MMLVEDGRIGLSDPVSRFIPPFAKTTVAERASDSVAIVPARRQIQIKDLLTHTSGMSYGTEAHIASMYQEKGLGPAAGAGWYTADKTEPICTTMERLATLPFVSHPGEAYVYGYNTDVLGCVVERASGMSLDEFIRVRLTGPLGMTDTHFYLPPTARSPGRGVRVTARRHLRARARRRARDRAPTSTVRASATRAAPGSSRPRATMHASSKWSGTAACTRGGAS